MVKLSWVKDDGGRADAGYTGDAGDCVVRSIAIAAQLPYATVYDALHDIARARRDVAQQRVKGRYHSPRTGVHKTVYQPYLAQLDAVWTPTMSIGSGCRVHLRAGEVPPGRLVVRCSGHMTAVVDGVIHDTYDPSRGGTRCVYGWWEFPA